MKKCPYCAEEIQTEAIKCRYCGEWLELQKNIDHSSSREALARVLHNYLRNNTEHSSHNFKTQPWESLPEDVKERYRKQADDTFQMLKAAYCVFLPAGGAKPRLIKFTRQEIEIMAKIEHSCNVSERFSQGWSSDSRKSIIKKPSPYLVKWEMLPENFKEYTLQQVQLIPELLARAGFEIKRIKPS